jgi:hypothetical protein
MMEILPFSGGRTGDEAVVRFSTSTGARDVTEDHVFDDHERVDATVAGLRGYRVGFAYGASTLTCVRREPRGTVAGALIVTLGRSHAP